MSGPHIKVLLRRGEETAQRVSTRDPVEAECAYLRWAMLREDGPAAVTVHSTEPELAPEGHYRLDADWRSPREQEPDRAGLWTPTAEDYAPPTPAQLRAAAQLLGLSGAEMARRLGITGRQWRYWVAADTERRTPEWAHWHAIRSWLQGATSE